jgi:hypothetical protein
VVAVVNALQPRRNPVSRQPALLIGFDGALAGTLQSQFRVGDFLDSLDSDAGEPAAQGFGLGGRDSLHDSETCFGGGAVGGVGFAVTRGEFQLYDFIGQLKSVSFEPLLSVVPEPARARRIAELRAHVHNAVVGDTIEGDAADTMLELLNKRGDGGGHERTAEPLLKRERN